MLLKFPIKLPFVEHSLRKAADNGSLSLLPIYDIGRLKIRYAWYWEPPDVVPASSHPSAPILLSSATRSSRSASECILIISMMQYSHFCIISSFYNIRQEWWNKFRPIPDRSLSFCFLEIKPVRLLDKFSDNAASKYRVLAARTRTNCRSKAVGVVDDKVRTF